MKSERTVINPAKKPLWLTVFSFVFLIYLLIFADINLFHRNRNENHLILLIVVINVIFLFSIYILFSGIKKVLRYRIVIEDGFIRFHDFDFGNPIAFDLRNVVQTSFFRRGIHLEIKALMLVLNNGEKEFISLTFVGDPKSLYREIEKYANLTPFDEMKMKANG